jgi:hypothetical protein
MLSLFLLLLRFLYFNLILPDLCHLTVQLLFFERFLRLLTNTIHVTLINCIKRVCFCLLQILPFYLPITLHLFLPQYFLRIPPHLSDLTLAQLLLKKLQILYFLFKCHNLRFLFFNFLNRPYFLKLLRTHILRF